MGADLTQTTGQGVQCLLCDENNGFTVCRVRFETACVFSIWKALWKAFKFMGHDMLFTEKHSLSLSSDHLVFLVSCTICVYVVVHYFWYGGGGSTEHAPDYGER